MRRTLAFLGLDGKDVAADDAMKFFRWQHNLQCGRPLKKSFFDWPESVIMFGRAMYNSRRLCYGIWESK